MLRPGPMLGVLALAAAIRLLSAAEVASSPQAYLSELPQSDMHWYARWAEEIAGGDWLGRDLDLLYTAWQEGVATPEEWERWFGGPRYNPAPAYLYVLASVYRIAGPDPRAMFFVQAGLGVVTCALLVVIGTLAFGPRAGVAAGLAGAVYGPLVFYEGFLLRTTWILCFDLAVLAGLLWARRGRPARFAVPGVAAAMAVLTQPTIAAFLPAAAVWIFFVAGSRRRGAATLATLALGFAGPMTVLVARNLTVGAPAFAVESRGPFALVFGNVAGGRSPGVGFSIPPGAVEILRESDYRTLPALAAALRTHDSVGAFIAFEARKLGAILSNFEVYNNVNYQDARRRSRVIVWLPGFAFAMAFGVIGLVLSEARRGRPLEAQRRLRERRPDRALVALFLLWGLAAAGISLVLSRYRMPFAVALLLYAGVALAWGYGELRARRFRGPLLAGCGGAIVGGLVALDLGVDLPRYRPAEPLGIAQILARHEGPVAAALELEAWAPELREPRLRALLLRQAAKHRLNAGQRGRARLLLERADEMEREAGPTPGPG